MSTTLMTHRNVLIGAIIVYCYACSLSAAETAETAQDNDAARDAFFRGIKSVEAGVYQDALSAFQASYRLHPKASVLINIAMCHQALSHFAEAYASFKRYLETPEAGAAENSSKTAAAMKSLEKLTGLVGRILIEDVETGTAIDVDGVRQDVSLLQNGIIVNPGIHTLEIKKEGYEQIRLDVTTEAGTTTRPEFEMRPITTPLRIGCKGIAASVFVDDILSGNCPLSKRMPPGDYRLRIEARNRRPWHRNITLKADEPTNIDVDLIPSVVVPPTDKEVDRSPVKKSAPALFVSGISSALLGTAGIIVGVVYTVNGARTHKAAMKLVENDDGSWTADKRAESEALLRRATVGMTVGYTAAGLLLSTGAALIWVDQKRKRTGAVEAWSLHVQWLGISVRF